MFAQTAETDAWSRRHLLAVTLGLMLGQCGIIFWLSRGAPAAPAPKVAPLVYISSRSVGTPPGVENPAAFVLPSALGFSGASWLAVSNPGYEPPLWTDRAAPKPTVSAPGGSLAEFLKTNTAARIEFSSTPEGPESAALPLPVAAGAASFLTIEGGLAGWPPVSPPRLPGIRANDILKKSVVLAGVTAQGQVFSAVLLEKSGSSAADEKALEAARALHFATPAGNYLPVNGEIPAPMHWGRLVFHWQTVAVPVTNSPASP